MPEHKKKKKQANGKLIPFPTKNKKADPDRLKKEIIEFVKSKKGCPAIANALGDEKLKEIAEKRTFEDVKKITEYLNTVLKSLVEGGHDYTARQIVLKPDVLNKFYDNPAFKSKQFSDAACDLADAGEDFRYAMENFVGIAIENLNLNILWKPLIDDLFKLDGIGAASYFLTGEHIEYMKQWDARIALLDEAREKFGLDDYVKIRSGRNVSLREGERFETTSVGAIYAPAYNTVYPDKERNMMDYRISLNHECGHHRWRSFRINLGILELEAVGAEFLGEGRAPDGHKVFRVAHKDKDGSRKVMELREYWELLEAVKYPKLLAFLHNVADDKRVDALNMMNVPGIAEEYAENIKYLLTKRPKLGKTGLGPVLEGLLQVTVAGKVNGEPDEKLSKRLKDIQGDLANMEIHIDTDGTDSMNVALKWYKRLEPELDELAKRVKEIDEELEKLLPENFTNSQTSIDKNDVRVVAEDPSQVIISRKKGKRPRSGRPGIDPFSFLNFDGKFEDKPDERNEGGTPGKSTGKKGSAGGRSKDGKEGKAYDEWSGAGYRKGTKIVYEHKAKEGREVTAPDYLIRKIKRMFSKYIPKDGVLVRGLDSGEIDPELFEEYLSKVDAGMFPEPDYYADVVHERSTAVFSVEIDLSTSMDEEIKGRRKVDIAAEGGALIAVAGNLLKIPVEGGGFTGSDTVEYYVLPSTKYSITVPSENITNATPMAGAARHANARTLELKKNKGKRFAYQFWICDGEPNCSGEGIDADVDTGKAIEEGRAKGIRSFGIIIATEERKKQLEESYRKIFGPRGYVVTTDVNQIPDLLLGFLKRIIYYK